ncbi:hypothetical protein Btru_015311 [Bulinus truncatus]|nr:hypothetical protein Btru_015311 [Bulinus truncatus]
MLSHLNSCQNIHGHLCFLKTNVNLYVAAAMKSQYFLLVGTIVTHISVSSKIPVCGKNLFYDSRSKQCKTCSTCPNNQIIKVPCSETADLECGPFNFTSSDSYMMKSYQKDSEYIGNGDFYEEEEESKEEPTTIEKEDREYWKTLAFALIGLLTILIIVATVVVLVACRKLQKATIIKQPDYYDTGTSVGIFDNFFFFLIEDDADSGYVVIRAIRNITDPRPVNTDYSMYSREDYDAHPPLLSISYPSLDQQSAFDTAAGLQGIPGRLCFLPKVYKPQRRLLTYDADDVFESEDSGGAYIPPLPSSELQTVMEDGSTNSKVCDT